jgi:hypothetical protein
MLLCAAGAVYMGWVWIPIYAELLEARQQVRASANAAVKDRDDLKLKEELLQHLRGVAKETRKDVRGKPQRVPVIDIPMKDLIWKRRENPPMLHVAFSYNRRVFYPIIKKEIVKTFDVDMDLDISQAAW